MRKTRLGRWNECGVSAVGSERGKWRRKRYRHSKKTWMPFCVLSWCSCEFCEAKLLLFCGGLFLWPVVCRHVNDGAFSSRLQLPASAAAQCNDIFATASPASTLPFDAKSTRAFPYFRLHFLVNFRRWCLYAFNFYYLMCAVNAFSFLFILFVFFFCRLLRSVGCECHAPIFKHVIFDNSSRKNVKRRKLEYVP